MVYCKIIKGINYNHMHYTEKKLYITILDQKNHVAKGRAIYDYGKF